jgi:hypothetical protein
MQRGPCLATESKHSRPERAERERRTPFRVFSRALVQCKSRRFACNGALQRCLNVVQAGSRGTGESKRCGNPPPARRLAFVFFPRGARTERKKTERPKIRRLTTMSLVGGIGSLSAFSPKKSQLLSGLSAIGGGSWQQVSRVGSAGCDEEEVEAGQGSSPPSAAPSRSAAARSDAIFDAPLLFSGTAAFAPPSSSPPIVVVASAAATACIVEKERERKRRLKGSSSFRQQAKKRGRGRERESPEGGGGGRPKAKSAKSESRERVFLSSLTLSFFKSIQRFSAGPRLFSPAFFFVLCFTVQVRVKAFQRAGGMRTRERERERARRVQSARARKRERKRREAESDDR